MERHDPARTFSVIAVGLFAFLASASGCSAAAQTDTADDTVGASDDAVVVDTSTPAARAQYDANVAFATRYVPRCVAKGTRPRVLVTGFGRFLESTTNATGMMVSRLVPGGHYPVTHAPPPGAVDAPEPQTSVTSATVTLPKIGPVDVCTMVLPVYWDLAAILVIKELDSFAPNLVMMNGIAGTEQTVWLELGSVNRAMSLEDGSDVLKPKPPQGQSFAPLVPGAAKSDTLRGLVLSWGTVEAAARVSIKAREGVIEAGRTFGSIALGAELGGFPRSGNTYLCNNLSYLVNYAMAYPGRALTLLQASRPLAGKTNRVRVALSRDLRATPRVFVHWPSTLAGQHLDAGAEVMKAMIDAQLDAVHTRTELPTIGTNDRAEISPSGDTF
jgi:hypothetical protein